MKEMIEELTKPGDPELEPGAARCPGRSVQDVLAAEDSAQDAGLMAVGYEFLGDHDLEFARYTSDDFYQQELTGLWPKVWQWACREEHLAKPGDFYVYDVGTLSAMVVKTDSGQLKAFVNACPHRGMQLADAGSRGNKQFIRCPFHGMTWELSGDLREIPCRWDFPHIQDDEFGLSEIPCDSWGGFVFINFDKDCAPLADYLEVLPEHFAHWGLEDRYVAVHTHKILPGNWKMCMEGFLEAFHVLATHPEALRTSSWANTQYDVFGDNVSRFLQNLSTGNPQLDQSESEIYRLLGYSDELPAGETARARHAQKLRENLGAELGVDLSGVNTSLMLDSIEYHLFPNACFFPGIQIPLIYRFRPLGKDKCIHEIMILQPFSGERPAPAEMIKLDEETSYTTVPNFALAYVLDQDTENFRRQWAGMLASQKPGQTLANYQEVRIRNLHNTLDQYLS